ncbi:MAG: SUMF1/EgtB/PvdO family nonheme iron enzyme [Hormoscilla sp. GM7CHS1pb]|nr:SUMF1/EgtB/PvdO family nonheme iron enzyme [Hormoscilla sp. GM7CHS1pb]
MYWQLGQTLPNSKYVIQKRLGGSGFSVTYLASSKDGRPVVIKTLNALHYDNESKFEQQQVKLVNEALSLAKCKHPQVVEIYEVVREGELWGMVMEYIDGKDLANHLENRRFFSEAEALPIIRQVGEALSYVHSQGFLHRDVKPANIVLRRDPRQAVLIDFGLAREYIDNRTLTQTNRVTYGFAPIEQYQRKAQRGAFTDVYALAATLYNLLTNQVPFPANFREQNVALIPPQQHNPQISDRINQGILMGMELSPENRPQSVEEFLRLLFPQAPVIQVPTFAFEVVTVNRQGKMINCRPQQAEYLADNLGNGIILEMVSIPGGSFVMGSPETEEGRPTKEELKKYEWWGDESPQHQVTVPPFYMGKYPITQDQWLAVASLPPVKEKLNPNPSYFKGGNRPVGRISWLDGVEFCARLTRETGRDYRLPSEAEWEYACRAGTTTPFHFGETITPDLANYCCDDTYAASYKGVWREQTTDVGIFPPNAFGLYDMHGNVWEWCADIFHKNYRGAPSDSSAWVSGGNDSLRLLRGGSWLVHPRLCRGAFRYCFGPGLSDVNIGLRVVCVFAR